MPNTLTPERRQLKRLIQKKRAGLVVKRGRREERVPCIILDSSDSGFKVGGTFRLRRGQAVELIFDEHAICGVLCNVMWVGKPGSKQAGEAGLQARNR